MSILATIIAGVSLFISSLFGISNNEEIASLRLDVNNLQNTVSQVSQKQKNVGATNAIPTPVALFETTLAANITSSATSMTLTSAADKTGTTLASSTYAFIIDEGSASEEMVLADCTATVCTNMTRGINVLTGTSTTASLQFAHRRGSSVKITDGPQIMILTRIINGIGSFPNPLTFDGVATYSTAPTFNNNNQLVSKLYVDSGVLAGAATSTETTTGISRLATKLQQASSTATTANTPYVLQAQNATSTYNAGTAGGSGRNVVVTQNNNTIDPNFIATSSNYTWTGTTTIQNLIGTISSTTYSGSTIDINWALGNSANVLLNQATTITFSNVAIGGTQRVFMCQDSTGSRTVTWPATMRWQFGSAPTLTTTASKCDLLSLIVSTSTTSIYGGIAPNF